MKEAKFFHAIAGKLFEDCCGKLFFLCYIRALEKPERAVCFCINKFLATR